MKSLTTYLTRYYKYQDKILLVHRPTETSSWRDRCFYLDEKYISNTPYNHRSILTQEVIIEYDFEDKEENKRLAREVARRLIKDDISYALWYSGNRSYHLHCFISINNATNLPLLKKTFIRHYTKDLPTPDLQLCAGNHLIRAEYGIHEKTKLKKTLLMKDSRYPFINKLNQEIWDKYIEEVRESINRRIIYNARDITSLVGFKYIVTSHEFRESEDGRERAMFMLIHVLKDKYKDRMSEFITFIQEWYRYSGGYKLSSKQIESKIRYHWNRHYTVTENYLNDLLRSIGKEELVSK
jgi:hypothetical protein